MSANAAEAGDGGGAREEEQGGLIINKHVFKAPAPKASVLGEASGSGHVNCRGTQRLLRAAGVRADCRAGAPLTGEAAPPPALPPLGLDRLAAQKRAEQGKQGTLLGEAACVPCRVAQRPQPAPELALAWLRPGRPRRCTCV